MMPGFAYPGMLGLALPPPPPAAGPAVDPLAGAADPARKAKGRPAAAAGKVAVAKPMNKAAKAKANKAAAKAKELAKKAAVAAGAEAKLEAVQGAMGGYPLALLHAPKAPLAKAAAKVVGPALGGLGAAPFGAL